MQAGEFARDVRAALARCSANIEAFAAGEPISFEETLEHFDGLFVPLNGKSGRVHIFSRVHPGDAMRASCEELEQEIAALATELSLNRDVYRRLTEVEPGEDATPEGRRLHEHALRDFRRSGVDRDDPTRERVRQLRDELVTIGQEFGRNIITGGREVVVQTGHAGLAGLPRDFLDAHPEREDGSVVLTTDPSDRMPVMTYAESSELRQEYSLAYSNRAVPENLEVLPRLLAKRHELATVLGYAHWADYVTEDNMTKSAATARAFVERVVELAEKRASEENDELLAEKREIEPGAEVVLEWERAYFTEKVRKRRFAFDSQEVRAYCGYEGVLAGILDTSARLYGVEFRELDVESWHSSVRSFDIVDGGEVLARFHLDMFPRENKYKHGAMFDLSGGRSEGVLPEAALVCNFPEPKEGDPGLLLFSEVTTFFHEVGHLLHHLFAGRQCYLAFAGIATEHDFVEVPSQLYEEWAWNPDVLASFARHFETGDPFPADLVRRMRAAEEYGRASQTVAQMVYALLSLTYYDRDPAGLDLTAVLVDLKERLLPYPHEDGTYFHASFGHLEGYSALYYTYMWSLVIAKDLFSRFESDPMDPEVAASYRQEVLAPGGSRDAADLVCGFLGREYSFDAFERWLGG